MSTPAPERGPFRGPFEFLRPRVEVAAGETRVLLPYRLQGPDGPVELTEVVTVPAALRPSPAADVAVRTLHLVAGVSYYKCVAPCPLVVPELSPAERALLGALYDQGLREFAYRNGFPVPLPVELQEAAGDIGPSVSGAVDAPAGDAPAGEPVSRDGGSRPGVLVPIGGGKDSALVADLVPDGVLFAVNPVGAQVHLAGALGRPLLAATRTLDPGLKDLLAAGAPNGHVPVTAITSAVAVLTAVAVGAGRVAMGIERSADEPSLVTAEGVAVNHQYSKSSEAEHLLSEVFGATGVRWFSLLRPLTELAIGAAVAARGLAPHIVSCNRVYTVWEHNEASRTQRACGECAKCLFTALMLAPASSPEAIAEQYGGALLDRSANVPAVRELWSPTKPFDCVGERVESAAALTLLAGQPRWSSHAVVAALATEAGAVVAASGSSAADLLRVGPVGGLPADFRDRVAALQADIDVAVPTGPAA